MTEKPRKRTQSAPPVEAPRTPHCVNCGAPAVYETDGKATTKRGYCQRHLPANVNEAMVEQYQRLSRQ